MAVTPMLQKNLLRIPFRRMCLRLCTFLCRLRLHRFASLFRLRLHRFVSLCRLRLHRFASLCRQLFPKVSGINPDALVRKFLSNPFQKRIKCFLILRFHRFTAQYRESRHIIFPQRGGDLLFLLFCKRFSVVKIPGLWLKTALAVVSAARDKKTGAHSNPVCNIVVFHITVVHGFSLNGMNALAME